MGGHGNFFVFMPRHAFVLCFDLVLFINKLHLGFLETCLQWIHYRNLDRQQ